MEVTQQMLLTVCPLVFFASCVDAIAGGGGLISLPAYLFAGLPPVLASGSNKFSACFGTLMATVRYLRGGKLMLKPGLLAVCGALPGSYLGAELLKRTPEQFVRVFMLVAIPVAALLMLIKAGAQGDMVPLTPARFAACFAIGLGCGFYDGFFGPGTGTFLILLFTLVARMDMVTASGTAKLVNLASNVAALTSFVIGGNVLYALALPAMICSALGGMLGAQLAIYSGARFVRHMMYSVLVLLVIRMAWEVFT